MALLRGINVGGKNSLPMRDLAALFGKAGATNVRTYIQSGNVVYDARPGVAATVGRKVAGLIASTTGLAVPVVTRTAAEWRAVARNHPWLGTVKDPAALHVVFLADRPAQAQVAKLDPARSAPDAFAVRGREIYLALPNVAGRTKLTNAYFDATLRTVSTMRNWRTVQALLALSAS